MLRKIHPAGRNVLRKLYIEFHQLWLGKYATWIFVEKRQYHEHVYVFTTIYIA